MAAAWNNRSKLLIKIECCILKMTSYSEKPSAIQVTTQLFQRTVPWNVVSLDNAGKLFFVGFSLNTLYYASACNSSSTMLSIEQWCHDLQVL